MLDPLAVPRPLHFFNFTLDPAVCTWEFVQNKVVPPVATPPNAPGGSVVKVTGANQAILPAALLSGMKFRNVPELRQVLVEVGCDVPKVGTGKTGGVVKADLAKALVLHQCPGQTEAKQNWMIEKMVGRKITKRLEDMPEDIDKDAEFLEIISGLDVEDCFDKLKNMAAAKHKEVVKLKRKIVSLSQAPPGAAPAPTLPLIIPHEGTNQDKWKTITPRELYPLLPGKHTLPYVYLKRLPNLGKGGRYQGVYQCCGHSFRTEAAIYIYTYIPPYSYRLRPGKPPTLIGRAGLHYGMCL